MCWLDIWVWRVRYWLAIDKFMGVLLFPLLNRGKDEVNIIVILGGMVTPETTDFLDNRIILHLVRHRKLPRHARRFQLRQILPPQRLLRHPQLVQIFPGINPAIVPIAEYRGDAVITHGP